MTSAHRVIFKASDNLHEAARLMWEADCGAVPVVDDSGRAVAMLTDRDICMAAYTQGKPLWEITASEVMSKTLQACRTEDTLAKVEELITQHQIRRIPVLDEQGRPVGIVSLNDLARAANKLQPAAAASSNGLSLRSMTKTLAAVCAPRHQGTAPQPS